MRRKITILLLLVLLIVILLVYAALRELFRAKQGNYVSDYSSGELARNVRLLHKEEGTTVGVQTLTEDGQPKENISEEMDKSPSEHASLVGLNDAADEFFDVPEPSDCDDLENGWTSDFGLQVYSQVLALSNNLLCCLPIKGNLELLEVHHTSVTLRNECILALVLFILSPHKVQTFF